MDESKNQSSGQDIELADVGGTSTTNVPIADDTTSNGISPQNVDVVASNPNELGVADAAMQELELDPAETVVAKPETEDAELETKKPDEPKLAPLMQLFRFATRDDKILMGVGTFFAVIAGAAFPFFALILGDVMDRLNGTNMMEVVAELALWFIYLGIGLLVSSYIEMMCWLISAENQARTVRELYLAAILRQEVGWHDLQSSGEQAVKLSTETRKFQDAIGDRFVQVIQYIAAFVSGIGIALYKGWELSLVLLAVSPVVIIVMGIMATVLSTASSAEQKAYGKAGAFANEVLSGIRTMFAFQVRHRSMLNSCNMCVYLCYYAVVCHLIYHRLPLISFFFPLFPLFSSFFLFLPPSLPLFFRVRPRPLPGTAPCFRTRSCKASTRHVL